MSKRIVFFLVFVISFASFAPAASAATAAEIQTLIQKLQQQIADLQKQLTQIQETSVSWCHTFNISLGINSQGQDVLALKEALAKEGILADQEFSDEFDEQTASYIVEFQEKYKNEILSPVKLKRGNGYVGKLTRAKLNKLYGCVTSAENKPPVISSIDGPSQLLVNEKGAWTLSVYDPENGKIYITVSWGDGEIAKGEKNLAHAYSGAGIYTIQFTAEDEQGLSAKKNVSVNVVSKETKNNSPKILTVNSQGEAKVGQAVTFTAEATDSDSDELVWSINWGDGNITPSGGCPVYSSGYTYYGKKTSWNYAGDHSWSKPGVYTVVFTANDCQGGANSYSVKINILATAATATTTPSITVVSPNGGEGLVLGTVYPVKINIPEKNQYEISFALYHGSAKLGFLVGERPTDSMFNWQVGKYQDLYGNIFTASSGQSYRISLSIPSQVVDFSDNYFSIVSAGTAKPDLQVTNLAWTPVSPTPGQWISFVATVKNDSLVDVINPFTVNLGGIATTIPSLKAGATTTVTASFGLTILGPNTVNVRVDIWDNISESNEQNNDFSGIVNVVGTAAQKPDLIIQDVTYKNLPKAGSDIYAYFDVVIKNIGQSTAILPGSGPKDGDEFTVDIYKNSISSENKIASGMRGTSLTLPMNESWTFSNITSHQNADLSNVSSIIAKIDATNKVDESNENNNTLTKTIIAVAPSITVVSPNGGEIWKIGSTYDIKWTASGAVNKVNIELVGDGSGWYLAFGVSASVGSYTWKAQGVNPGSSYKINIWDAEKVIISDQSNNYFTIVTPAYPGFFMQTDKSSYLLSETVNLTLKRADGQNSLWPVDVYAVETDQNAKTLLYPKFGVGLSNSLTITLNDWPVFKNGGAGQYLLLVCDGGKECVGGVNTNSILFTIVNPSITVFSPNGGEIWKIGSTYDIKWSTVGLSPGVSIQIGLRDIRYSSELGSGEATIANIADSGIYSWTVPVQLDSAMTLGAGNVYKVVVYVGGGVSDLSNNHFSITALAATTTPITSVPTTGFCTDSDGGKNIYQQGTAKDADETQTDSCSVYSGNRILEWWCRDNNYVEGYYEDCPAGYSCSASAGACVVGPTSSVSPENQLADISRALQKMAEEIKKLLNK